MDQKHSFKLIDNTYSAIDAREIISTLLTDKIRMLNVQILGIQERYGRDTSHLQKRIEELEADRARMIEILTMAIQEDAIIEVASEVRLTAKKPAHIEA